MKKTYKIKSLYFLENRVDVYATFEDSKVLVSIPQMNIINVSAQYALRDHYLVFHMLGNKRYGTFFFDMRADLLSHYIYGDKTFYFRPTKTVDPYYGKDPAYGPQPPLSELLALLEAGLFANQEGKLDIKITYPEIDTEELIRLKSNLPSRLFLHDSQIDCCLFLLRFVHRYFPYNGMVSYPAEHDALYFFHHASEGMNCRTFAITLTDLLNAAGVKSRMIHCLPYDTYDIESHFVVEAYVQSLNKWIMLDPSFGCYIEDCRGVPLNVYEIRNSIVERKQMNILTNGTTLASAKKIDKESYMYALTKNLYRFQLYHNYIPGFDNSIIEPLIIDIFPKGYIEKKRVNALHTSNIEQFYQEEM